MNRHTVNAYNADIVLRRITLESWIIKNASDDRLARLLEVIEEEIDRRDWEALGKVMGKVESTTA